MDTTVQQLLMQISSTDQNAKDDALLTLSFLFEYSRHSSPDDHIRAYYSNYLPENLLNSKITHDLQRLIVQSLIKVFEENDQFSTTGFLRAIGSAAPDIAMEGLLFLILKFPSNTEERIMHQAITFLGHNLDRDDLWHPLPIIVKYLKDLDPLPIFSSVIANTSDKELLYVTHNAIASIKKYLADAKSDL